MDIHEYQAKQLLTEYGVKIADGGLAYSPEDAVQRAREIGAMSGWLRPRFIQAPEAKPVASRCANP